ncbi:precorrin-6A/cobalt-precorrin-6A reductase family protein [Celeribacter naphthalenivorans]|uniref:hypothetical protein n=1 Tax=Celeribacter naphthalenivorans TaxID=1614694 RepID=UPI001CFB582D|nr:hypothetical protein [Celeribacter naphthalenivorans]
MILLLAGTTEARNLADHLVEAGIKALVRMPDAAESLEGAIARDDVTAVIDASPACSDLTAESFSLCEARGLPFLRFERASLRSRPGDMWQAVFEAKALAALIPEAARVTCSEPRLRDRIAAVLPGRELSVLSGETLSDQPTEWLVVFGTESHRGLLDAARERSIKVAFLTCPPPLSATRREHLLDALEWAESHAMASGDMM